MTSLTWIITGLGETVRIRKDPYMRRVSPDGGNSMANPCDGKPKYKATLYQTPLDFTEQGIPKGILKILVSLKDC